VVRAPAPKINELTASLPTGDRVVVGGAEKESGKSQASVIAVLPVMLVLMLTILMVQLQGFNRLFLVLSLAPLGLIGVVTALLVSGKPLGFVVVLGAPLRPLMGWSSRAPAPPAREAGKGPRRQGARHAPEAQGINRRDRHRYRQDLVSRRGPG
jgi:hypothetical protein